MPIESAQIEEVFVAASEIADTGARAAYLEKACGGDAALRERVDALLAAHDSSDSFLQIPDESDTATVAYARVSEGPGSRIGRYKLLEEIGEGGFGVVFMAEQEEPVRRRVALKIIKAGMDTRQVVARFEAERQALAMMDHSNIARVFDAGATDTGRPYFVMELVKGIPITTYCDEQKLNTDERLKLFIAVCSAVQHAHQKGIIHRDLKPSNVMVTLHDDKPVPKIIDFGIAKATQTRLTDKTLFTEFRQLIGTPAYMSPEQAQMIGLDVDTRSDIYSLGVLLYELLTGTTPFDSKELLRSGYDEMRRIIREVEPPRPSTRLSTLANSGTAATRESGGGGDPKRLSQQLRGDLDWIVMKCLEKDRTRRYESAGNLAADIECHLADEPVQAYPPSAVYRFRKFARRNQALIIAGSAISVALLIGLGLSTWMYFRERSALGIAKTSQAHAITESARAQAVSDLLQEMLGSADADVGKGSDYTVRELLDDFSAGLDEELSDQPEVKADIHATIGHAYTSLKQPSQAQPHLEKAIELLRNSPGADDEKLAAILVDYARSLQHQSKFAEADRRLGEALAIYQNRGISGAPVVHALWRRLVVLRLQLRIDEADAVAQQALNMASKSPENESPTMAGILHDLAYVRMHQGRFAEAEELAQRSVAMHRRIHGGNYSGTAFGMRCLADALYFQQKFEAAETAAREALTILRRQYPAEHVNIREATAQLESILIALKDWSGVEALHNEEAEQTSGSNDPDSQIRLAKLLLSSSPPNDAQKLEAHRLVRRAVEHYDQLTAEQEESLDSQARQLDHFMRVATLSEFGPEFADERDDACRRVTAKVSQTALDAQRRANPMESANALFFVAPLQLRLGDVAGYRASCKALFELPLDKLEGVTKSRAIWTPCIGPDGLDDPTHLVKLAEEFLADTSPNERLFGVYMLGATHYRAGQFEQAAQRLDESIAAFPTDATAATYSISYPRIFLAMTKWQLGQKEEARKLLAETLPSLQEELDSPSSGWNRRATLEILRAEAEALIK